MTRNIRLFFSAFIVLSLAVIAALALRHYWKAGDNRISLIEGKRAGVQIDSVHYSSSRQGRLEWELDAKSAARYGKDGLVELKAVRFVYHAKDGAPYTLTAREAGFREADGEIDAAGDVLVESAAGYTLKTDRLKYSLKTRKATSDARVEIISGGINVTGSGLLIELDKGKLTLYREVHAVLKDKAV